MFDNKRLSGKILCGAVVTSSMATFSMSAVGNAAVSNDVTNLFQNDTNQGFFAQHGIKVAVVVVVFILICCIVYGVGKSGTSYATVEDFNEVYFNLQRKMFPLVGKEIRRDEKMIEGKVYNFSSERIGDNKGCCFTLFNENLEGKANNDIRTPYAVKIFRNEKDEGTGIRLNKDKESVNSGKGAPIIWDSTEDNGKETGVTRDQLRNFEEEVLALIERVAKEREAKLCEQQKKQNNDVIIIEEEENNV